MASEPCVKCGAVVTDGDLDLRIVGCEGCNAHVCDKCLSGTAYDAGKFLCGDCFERMYERFPECRGSGKFEVDPSGAFSMACPACDRNGFIEKTTDQSTKGGA